MSPTSAVAPEVVNFRAERFRAISDNAEQFGVTIATTGDRIFV
jgi:hypothetical protein